MTLPTFTALATIYTQGQNHLLLCAFLALDARLCYAVSSIMAYALWPYGPQPARLLCPWDSPAKNTGYMSSSRGSSQPRDWTCVSYFCIAGWFFTISATWEVPLNECEVKVTKSCPTLCDPMDCSLPGSSIHGIFQARILEWIAVYSSRGSSQFRNWTQLSCIASWYFTIWAIRDGLWMNKWFISVA